MLRVIRACCAPSGSLPQDWQKSTSRKRKARDSCWGKMHQSAWLKAIISRCGVWNVEEWSLWRIWIVYLFTFVVLIFPPNEHIFHEDWVRSGVLNLLFVSGSLLCAVRVSWDTKHKHEKVPCYNKWCFVFIENKLCSVFQVMWQRGRSLGRAEYRATG